MHSEMPQILGPLMGYGTTITEEILLPDTLLWIHSPFKPLFEEFFILTVYGIYKYQLCIFMYKLLNNLMPNHFFNKISVYCRSDKSNLMSECREGNCGMLYHLT